MEHSEVLSKVEAAISNNVHIININRVDCADVSVADIPVLPGKDILPGKYGVVDIRILLPLAII